MFRVAPEECVGHKVYEVGGRSWDTKLKPMLEAVLHGAPQSDHFELIHDGKPGGQAVHWLSARLVPSADAGDATILLAIEDLSTGGSAEENLALRTQELNNLADLAGRSAHELNNMLTVIRMNADLIEGTLNQAKLSAGEAVDIRNAADRAEALTKKLLLASRRTLPQPTGLDRGVVTVPLPGSPLRNRRKKLPRANHWRRKPDEWDASSTAERRARRRFFWSTTKRLCASWASAFSPRPAIAYWKRRTEPWRCG
jgi:hypothetical protein